MLPDPVRARVVALGSDILGTLALSDVPAALRPVARFAAAKRARLGGAAIAAAIESEPSFRRKVFETVAKSNPMLVRSLENGEPPAAADPVEVAAIAYLQRPEGWEDLVDAAAAAVEREAERSRGQREAEVAARIQEQLDAARAHARETRDRLRGEVNRLKEENSTLRRTLQQTRSKLSAARDAEADARTEAATAVEQAQAAQKAAESEARRLRSRLAEAEEAAAANRRTGRGERDLGTARLTLLLDTLSDAVTGVRRELALPAHSLRPADTVQAVEPAQPRPASGVGSGRAANDPALLSELLALPRAHAVVDGYNVTKEAWPATPLDAQRTRLLQGLTALAARTGAEVTCVFDGSDVSVPPPVGLAPGVRVRFSRPGQTADELIRDLIAAEPEGRVGVVVSSDREVAESVRRPGVRSVEAAALVGLLRT
ncbi:NYN domain-containing protein [Phytoactinopolyspora mesophila]|uniref:NYN domain-containing protein n=1 Tax=Phytoactinopolyspora mesophila TaxID=2650750 RepID=UPI001C9E5A1D